MPGDPNELIRLGPFGGLDDTTALLWAADSPTTQTQGVGYVLDRSYQSLVTTLGRARLFTAPVPVVHEFDSFALSDTDTQYIICGDAGIPTQGAVFIAPEDGPATQILPLPEQLTPGLSTFTAQYGPWIGLSNGVDTPIKIDTSLKATLWGISAPNVMLHALASTSGGISAVNAFSYVQTFANSVQESSPSTVPVTVFGALVSGQNIAVSNLATSTDPQVTISNIYRGGGDSGQAGTFIFDGSVPNGTTTFLDTTPDGQLTGGTLIVHRDPPQAFFALAEWQDRVWGFGYSGIALGTVNTPASSDLWYSNYAEMWGFDDTNQVIPVGRNSGDDIAIGMAPLSGILLLHKRRSLWALPGPPPAQPIPLYNIGCDSPRSICVILGQDFWLGDDNCIYTFGGGSYTDIGLPIKTFLDTLTAADRAVAASANWDHNYVLSFPTLGTTLRYDLRTSTWTFLPFAFNISASRHGHVDPLLMLASETGSGSIDQWFFGESDRGSPIGASFASKLFDGGDARYLKQIMYALLVASAVDTTKTALLTLTITGDPGTATANTSQKVINLQQNFGSYLFELPQSVSGRYIQITLATSSTTRVQVDRLSLYGSFDTALGPNVL